MDWKTDTQTVIDLSSINGSSIRMVTSMNVNPLRSQDSEYCGVIIRRKKKEERLWDIAKRYGSTVQAIEKTNQLEQEPEDDRLLLIPVL